MSDANERYVAMIRRTLKHWVDEVEGKSDADLGELLKDNSNLQQAVTEGLAFPDLWDDSANTLLRIFPLIDRLSLEYQWLDIVNHAVQNSPHQGHGTCLRLMNRLGQIKYKQRITSLALEAEQIHKHVLMDAIAQDDQLLIGETQFHLAEASFRSGQLELAEEYGLKAIENYEKLAQPLRKQASVFALLGRVMYTKGAHQKAQEYYWQAAQQYKESGAQIEYGRMLNNIGQSCNACKEYDGAIECYRESISIMKKADNEVELIVVQTNLATTFFHQDKLENALQQYEGIDISFLRANNKHYLLGIVNQSIGNIEMRLGRFSKSLAHLNEAIAAWEYVHNKPMMANSLGTKGQLFQALGENKNAKIELEKALSILYSITDNEWATKLTREFSEAYKQLTGQAWGPDPLTSQT